VDGSLDGLRVNVDLSMLDDATARSRCLMPYGVVFRFEDCHTMRPSVRSSQLSIMRERARSLVIPS
jgi:hypothetical protein